LGLGIFWDRVSWTICPRWLQTTILLISASWVASITDVSHQHLVQNTLNLCFQILLSYLGTIWSFQVLLLKCVTQDQSHVYPRANYCLPERQKPLSTLLMSSKLWHYPG
jgi:hypothetical protein